MHSVMADGQLARLFERIGSSHRARSIDPWIVVDDLLSAEEADNVLREAQQVGFEKSRDSRYNASHRTSSTAYLSRANQSATQLMEARASELLRIPVEHASPIQVVRYAAGEHYRTHHDQNALRDEPWGVRALTMFIYLSDPLDDDAGGETLFPELGLSVTPKKGRAVVWPNVRLDSPDESDRRTFHAGAPVRRGFKYGANMWWHPFPYRPFLDAGCSPVDHAQYAHPNRNMTRWSAAANILVWNSTFGGYGGRG